MTQFILVRHGQTAWNRNERFRGHADIPLDETGLAQADATAKRIVAQWKPVAVYAGPLARTMQTGEATARLLGLQVQPEPGLLDADCGEWEGHAPQEAEEKWPAEYELYLYSPAEFRFPGGESLEHARARAWARVLQLSAMYPRDTVMLVSHTALNRLILLSVLGLDAHAFWNLRQDTCAINLFDMEGETCTLVTLNETGHLLSTRGTDAPVRDTTTI